MIRLRVKIGFILMLVTWGGCAIEAGNPGGPPEQISKVPSISPTVTPTRPASDGSTNAGLEFERFRELWKAKRIGSYDFEASLYVGGTRYFAEPVRVKVRSGDATSIQPIDKNNKASVDGYSEFQTVEKMFEVIERAIKNKLEFKAEYNKDFGYPESILVLSSSSVTDASKRLKVHRLRIIN